MQQIFENKPLIFLQLRDERILIPWTKEKLKHKLSFDFLDAENGRIIPTAKNVILDSGVASAYDYFEFYLKKTVEPWILSRFYGRTAQMSEKEKHKLTNVQIWGFIEKLREEEWYYSEKHEKIPSEKFAELDKKNREKLGIRRPFSEVSLF